MLSHMTLSWILVRKDLTFVAMFWDCSSSCKLESLTSQRVSFIYVCLHSCFWCHDLPLSLRGIHLCFPFLQRVNRQISGIMKACKLKTLGLSTTCILILRSGFYYFCETLKERPLLPSRSPLFLKKSQLVDGVIPNPPTCVKKRDHAENFRKEPWMCAL